jgi:hypothetical protein
MTQESADEAIGPEWGPILDRIDDAFEAELDAPPADLLDAARAAFSWRLDDAQLAELLFDSASEGLAGVRGAASDLRSFRYGAGEHVIRVHLTSSSLVVMIEPPLVADCRVVTEAGTSACATDEFGELVVEAPTLPLRVEIDLPGGRVATPWITG